MAELGSSPCIMQFVQPDTLIPDLYNPQSLNRYSYVNNNPIRYNDPTGHVFEEGTGGVGGPCNIIDCTGNSSGGSSGGNNGGPPPPSPPSDPVITTVPSTSPHEYWALNPVCLDAFWINCTDAEVYDYMSRWQYPGQFFWQPVAIGGSYDVFPGKLGNLSFMDYFYPGSGSIFVEFDGYTISNVADPSHVFYDGRVDRTPIRIDGNPYVVTHGTGTNDGFYLGNFDVGNWTVDVGVPGSWIDAANNTVGTTAFNIQDFGLLVYTTVVETRQFFLGSQQFP